MRREQTDSALIINAMDLLRSGAVGGFCVVSSDGDFARLATRIREQGLFVMEIGRPETARSFINTCEVSVGTSNLGQKDKPQAASRKSENGSNWAPIVRKAIEATDGTDGRMDGWAPLSAAGSYMRKLDPAFDPRSFGHKSLSGLIKSCPESFRTRTDGTDQGRCVGHPRQGG